MLIKHIIHSRSHSLLGLSLSSSYKEEWDPWLHCVHYSSLPYNSPRAAQPWILCWPKKETTSPEFTTHVNGKTSDWLQRLPKGHQNTSIFRLWVSEELAETFSINLKEKRRKQMRYCKQSANMPIYGKLPTKPYDGWQFHTVYWFLYSFCVSMFFLLHLIS